jgi:AraC-like DNA-binding protein
MKKESVIDYFVRSEHSFNPLEVVHISETVTNKTALRIRFPEFSGLCFNLGDGIEYGSKDKWKSFRGSHYTLIHTIGRWLDISLQPGHFSMLMIKLPADFMELFLERYPAAISTYCAATKFLTFYSPFGEPQVITHDMQFALNIVREFRSVDNALHVQILNALIVDLVLLHLSPIYRPYEMKVYKETDLAMERARNLLHEYTRRWTPDLLADALSMHKRSLNTKFKATFGVSPMEYLREFRLNVAVNLLNEGMSVTDVAKRIGYKYHQDFDRAFKRKFHCSPLSVTKGVSFPARLQILR